MNRLSEAVTSGDLDKITTTINEVSPKSIVSYLLSIIDQEINGDILNHLLTRLPSWYEDDRTYVTNCIQILSHASLDNLEIILEHPTFSPPPIINRYISVSLPSFHLMIMSSKMGSDDETLACLLHHNHPDKIKSYLASDKVIIPPPEKIANLATSYSGHHYSLYLILEDPRFDLSKLEGSFLKKCVDDNITIFLDVLKVRLENKITPLIEKKKEQERKRELYHPVLA